MHKQQSWQDETSTDSSQWFWWISETTGFEQQWQFTTAQRLFACGTHGTQ
jgi:hypothetical protein